MLGVAAGVSAAAAEATTHRPRTIAVQRLRDESWEACDMVRAHENLINPVAEAGLAEDETPLQRAQQCEQLFSTERLGDRWIVLLDDMFEQLTLAFDDRGDAFFEGALGHQLDDLNRA